MSSEEKDLAPPKGRTDDGASKEVQVDKKGVGYSRVMFWMLCFVVPSFVALGYKYFLDNSDVKVSSIQNDTTDLYSKRKAYYKPLNSPEPGVLDIHKIPSETHPESPISFTVHFNGDGLSEGFTLSTINFNSLDELITKYCRIFVEDKPTVPEEKCAPQLGAKLFSHGGRRIYSLKGVEEGGRTYIVPAGVMFIFPLGKVGSVIYPETISDADEVKLIQLSEDPRVFSVENFIHPDEIENIIEHNRELVERSEVGFAGWQDKTRTSYTAWDSTSWAAKKVQKRSFDLLSMPYDPNLADAVQVLRYRHVEDENGGEWYKPHVDWFDSKGFDGHDPEVNNGTNRFATVFLYLTTLDEDGGGTTVFPLSKSHEGYNASETLVRKGTEKVVGFISDRDARHVCSRESSALKVRPVAGSAVLFYSQGPTGNLDKMSLHGGCPVTGDKVKWSANVWLWNRPKPMKSEAKDGKAKTNDDRAIDLTMQNTLGKTVGVFWDDGTKEMVFQMDIDDEDISPMRTYKGHRFGVKEKLGSTYGPVFAEYRAKKEDNEQTVEFKLLA